MGRKGRNTKYSQPKSNPLYIKLTDYGRKELKKKASQNNLSEGELIEQFARSLWIPNSELQLISDLLAVLQELLLQKLVENPNDLEILTLLNQIAVIMDKISR